VHVVPHIVFGDVHPDPDPVEHTPLKHDCPDAQAFPHDPQFFASVIQLTHVPLQLFSPVPHPDAPEHAPFTHDFPDAHTFPQEPQLEAFVSLLTHPFPHTEYDELQ